MALVFADGFDDLAASSNPSFLGWDPTISSLNWVVVADRYSDNQGRALGHDNNGRSIKHSFVAEAVDSTVILGVSFDAGTPGFSPGVYYTLFVIYASPTTTSIRAVVYIIDGRIEVRAGSSTTGTLLASTPVAVVDTVSYYYIEVKYISHASAGAVTLRVNELEVASAAGINTTGGVAGTAIGAVGLVFSATSTTPRWLLDDFYICNGLGATNNDFLGDIRVLRLRPNSDVVPGWVPTGDPVNHYENVDSGSTGDGTNNPSGAVYNASNVDETTEYYGLEDLPATATGVIKGTIEKCGAWCSVLNVSISPLMKDGLTEVERTPVALSTTAHEGNTNPRNVNLFMYVDETKPTGGEWTASAINALQLGQRVKSIT